MQLQTLIILTAYCLNQNFRKMDTSKNFYVGIQDAKTFRRNLLEASRSIVSVLKANHKITNLRSQKQKYLDVLRTHVKEINQLIVHLDAAMPDVGIRASKIKKEESRSSIPPINNQSINMSELDHLESQIREIDSKLNNLQ